MKELFQPYPVQGAGSEVWTNEHDYCVCEEPDLVQDEPWMPVTCAECGRLV
jgi:hypothetical protein